VIRDARTDADLEAWTRIRNAVETYELSTVDETRRMLEHDSDRVLFLAELEGDVVGCALASTSSLPGCGFVLPRVVSEARRRGLGTQLLQAGSSHVRKLGREALVSRVSDDDEAGLAFGTRFGFEEIDREIELVYPLSGSEQLPEPPHGVALVEVTPDLYEAAYAVAVECVPDLALTQTVEAEPFDQWIGENAAGPVSLVAVVEGEVVGFAGLIVHGARPGVLENTLTAVRRPYRGRGIALALKRELIGWAAANGYREVVTWTQQGNAAMQAVNEKVGYRPGQVSITLSGPLLP